MNTPRTPRNQLPIDPLLRLQQIDRSRQQQLPPPSPAPRRSVPTATTLLPSGAKPSAQASARIAALAAARGTASGPGTTTAPRGGKPVGKRAKPARAAKVASLALSAVTTIGLAGMFADQNGQTDSIVLTQGTIGTVAATTATTAAPAATVAGDTATTVAATTATTAAPVATGQVLDGTYVGAGDSNRWGTVQVQAVYSGGQLVDVQILQYPDGDNKSVQINQRALPTLINASLSSQSASVSTVSGATYTSDSYKTSLQSAIDAAKAASGISG